MKISRRTFLVTGAAVSGVRIAEAQPAPSFTLDFPPAPIDTEQPLSLAVVASASCVLQIQLFEGERGLLEPVKWTMEPKKPVSIVNQNLKSGTGEKTVRAFVYPTGPKRSHIAGVITTGAAPDRRVLEQTAERVPFYKDPAPRNEEGHFAVNLRTPSDVLLKIWRDDKKKGPIVRQEPITNVSAGESNIPWNLLDSRRSVVAPGEYLATLVATPKNASRSNTIFFASFEVI